MQNLVDNNTNNAVSLNGKILDGVYAGYAYNVGWHALFMGGFIASIATLLITSLIVVPTAILL